jgi:magnesium transporter
MRAGLQTRRPTVENEFKFMPELDWHWGYFAALGVMFVIFVLMLMWFRRKRFI